VRTKAKTHRGAAKRFKVTASGKILRNAVGRRHLLETKSPKRKRRLQRARLVSSAELKRVKAMLPYR